MSRRLPRWEVVRTDAGWHVRYVSSNGRTIVSSEVYKRRGDAVRGMWLVRDGAVAHYEGRRDTEVREVDERTPAPEPSILTPPFYVTTTVLTGDEFWHDSEYHYRNCFGDDCREGAPPQGREVRTRFGSAVPSC